MSQEAESAVNELMRAFAAIARDPGKLTTIPGVAAPNKVWQFNCGELEDPVVAFWSCHKEHEIPDGAMVVFLDVKPGPGWRDLQDAFGGVEWEGIFMLRYRRNVHGIYPSQKGLFIKR